MFETTFIPKHWWKYQVFITESRSMYSRGRMSNITVETLVSSNPLGKYDAVVRWLRDKKPKTIDMYLRSLGRFSERSGLNPDEILDWAKRSDSSVINDTISKYADDLS